MPGDDCRVASQYEAAWQVVSVSCNIFHIQLHSPAAIWSQQLEQRGNRCTLARRPMLCPHVSTTAQPWRRPSAPSKSPAQVLLAAHLVSEALLAEVAVLAELDLRHEVVPHRIRPVGTHQDLWVGHNPRIAVAMKTVAVGTLPHDSAAVLLPPSACVRGSSHALARRELQECMQGVLHWRLAAKSSGMQPPWGRRRCPWTCPS